MGLFMFMLTFVVAPIVGLISVFGLGIEPWPVGIAVVLLGLGGLLRIIYALMFESKVPPVPSEGRSTGQFKPVETFSTSALPPQRDMPAAEYVLPVQDSPEPIGHRSSVTEDTTRLLEKEPE